jgi:Zn-dependent peptidase ImmA (M78 family)
VKALILVLLWATRGFAAPTTFEISLHVVKDAQTPEWLAAQVAKANKHFEAVDAAFVVATRDELAGKAHIVTCGDRNALAKLVTDNKIHVFIVEKLENVDDDAPIFGVTWRADGKKYIIIGSNAPERVLAHELGHVFGLPHSTYAISIMNKTKRETPRQEDRRFADEELALLRPMVKKLAATLATQKPDHSEHQ